MQAQYSVPFCIALACVRDVRDPRSLDESALTDAAIEPSYTACIVKSGTSPIKERAE